MRSTEGIILKKTDSGEADALFTIYTKDFGKIWAFAQGVKKEGAKLKGHLEPLSLSAISFVLGKNGERLTHANLIKFFPETRKNYEKLAASFYILNLVDHHCLRGEKDERLWNLLKGSLSELEQKDFSGGQFNQFLRSFEAKFLSSLGYEGETDISTLGL